MTRAIVDVVVCFIFLFKGVKVIQKCSSIFSSSEAPKLMSYLSVNELKL